MNYIDLPLPTKNDTVIVGMSGGVDSTLTALMLKEKGCRVIGVTMKLWDGRLPQNVSIEQIKDACYGPSQEKNCAECKKFCDEHDIPYYEIDLQDDYKKNVLDYFINEYRNGRTPNPCIRCNATMKFGALLEGVEKLGIKFDYFCTGHYAKIVRPENGIFESDEKPCMISGALDASKDQTYFLYRVSSKTLEKVRFPLASLKKSEVYELAKKANLDAANREESQDFIGDEYFDLLFSDKESIPGDIIDLDGKVLGKHKGIEHYTVGQRRGLGVAVNYPVYVHSIDAVNNVVVLAPNDALFSNGLIADDFVWPSNVEPNTSFEAYVKIRLASKPVKAIISRYEQNEDEQNSYVGQAWKIMFLEPQRAVAPGQSVVIYSDGVICGGGIINRVIR